MELAELQSFDQAKLLFSDDDLIDNFEYNNGYDSSSSLISDSDGTLADSDSSIQKKNQITKSIIGESLKNIKNEMKYKIKENIRNNSETIKEGQEKNELILKEKLNKLAMKVQLLQKEQAILINIIKDHTKETINESKLFSEEYLSVDKNIINLIERDSQYMKQCEDHLQEFINKTIYDYNILLAEKELEVVEQKEIIKELNKKIDEKNYENEDIDNYEELLSEMMEQMKIDEEAHQVEVNGLKEEIKIRDDVIEEIQEQNQIYHNSLENLFQGLSQKDKEEIDAIEDVQQQVIYVKDLYTRTSEQNEKQIYQLKELLDSKDKIIEELKYENTKLINQLNEKENVTNEKYKLLQKQNKEFKNLAIEIRASVSQNKKKNEEDMEILKDIIKKKDEALVFSNDRINNLKETIDKLNEEILNQKRKLNDEHRQFKKEFSELKRIIKDNEKQIENLQDEVEHAEKSYRKAKEKIEKYKIINTNSKKEVNGLWNVIDIREKEVDELNKEKERLEEENKEFIKQHTKDIEYLEKIRQEYEEKIKLMKEASEKEKIEMIKKSSGEIEKELQNQCDSLSMQKDLLKNDLEIMSKSVKLLQKDSKILEENNKNLEESIKSIEKKQKDREEYWKCENRKIELKKDKEINILINNNKDLEEQLKKERIQSSNLAKYIRDINHQEVLNIKAMQKFSNGKSTNKPTASLKNFSDRVELYQKVLSKKMMNEKINLDTSLSFKHLNNQMNEKQMDVIKNKSIKLLNFFQNS